MIIKVAILNTLITKGFIDRRYIMEDFFHSFSEINNITFDGYNEEKSIFNPNFKTKTRWIKDKIDYDKKE